MIQYYTASKKGVGEAMDMIRSFLERKGVRGRENVMVVLAAEESMGDLVAHSEEGELLRVSLHALFGSITLECSVRGNAYDFWETYTPSVTDLWAVPDSAVDGELRRMVLRNYERNLKYRHRNGVNAIRMTVTRSTRALWWTLGALFAAILIGVALSLLGIAGQAAPLDENFLTPVKTIYMNALKMIAAPVVFFSIVGCISQQSNLSGIGRIGGKILGFYLLTSMVAVAVGIGVFHLFRPGDPSVAAGLTADVSSITSQAVDISIRDIIVGIVPSNFLAPFLESNMIQLIFLAVLAGIAVGQIGDYSKRLRELIDAFSELFLQITRIIMLVTPFAVFCAILSMVMKMGPSSLLSLLGMLGTFLFGLACMIVIYCVILLISGLNPLLFLRKYAPSMLQVFSIASSNAAIPINLDACKKELAISPGIYNLSIPLGATINMDGTCILLAIQALSLAKIYGVSVSGSLLVTLAFSILLMSVGAPGVPGSGIIILSMLLTQIGVPVEGVALFMGIGPLVGMFICMCNCLGDVVITAAVARSEKMMDMAEYRLQR